MLNLKNICQSYLQGDSIINVLSKLNFSVNGVKNIGIIGPSGSGKSTILNILGMIETPTSGEYILKGNNCLNLSQNLKTEIRKKFIGYIFQNNQLLEDFNVLENIAFPLILNGESFGDAKKKSLTLLAKLGLTNKKFIKPGLLSGGEQALTALSLIFAVFLTNPSPICVLDEVDAPLDDANVTRFCSLLEELTKITNTKFIIVTHHALTMSKMNRLYGVTMPQKGISQLVAVDLQKAASMVA